MATKKTAIQVMLDTRREELLKLKYPANAVDLAIEWAVGTAQGMAEYFVDYTNNHDDERLQQMMVDILPRYLKDCDTWIKKTCL